MKMSQRNLCPVVTQDETRVHHFDPEAKKQRMQWKHPSSPPPKKFKRVSSAGKVMASIFWVSWWIILKNNGAYYAEELRQLCQEIVKKRTGKFTRSILLLQDNAPAHNTQVDMAAVTKCSFKVLLHPLYSPDLAP